MFLSRSLSSALLLFLWASSLPAFAAIDEQPTRPSPEEAPAPQLTKPPALLTFVEALYPPELLAQGIDGDVLMVIDIDAEGGVELIEVLQSSHPEFAAPAMVAVAGFTFSPAEIDNQPSAIRIQYRYRFVAQTPEEGEEGAADQPPPPPPINFQGVILEAGVREPIVGAVISVNGKAVARSDATGRFEVRGLPPGQVKVSISSAYHETYTLRELILEDIVLVARYYLVRVSDNPFQTVVRGKIDRREVARIQLSREELSKVPGTFGDPIRVIENLPGMARTPGGLGGSLLVRGANPDDSQVYIDGIEVPLIYHFGGLTSIINAEFLENIDFYPGGFSARYGRAIAGIVDVKTRDLDCKIIHGSAKIDLVDSTAYICVPLGEWTVAAAARRSYVDVLIPKILERIPRGEDEGSLTLVPVYWDYQLKAQGKINQHTLDVFLFGSRDRFKLLRSTSDEDNAINFGVRIEQHRALLRDRFRISPKATFTSSLTPSRTMIQFRSQSEELDFDNSFILDTHGLEWREELEVELFDGVLFSAGMDLDFQLATIRLNFPIPTELKQFETPVFDFTNTQSFSEHYKSFNHGYWAEFVLEPSAGLKIIPGLRLQRFDQGAMQDFSVQPRITGRWQVNERTVLKGAFGIYDKAPEPRFVSRTSGNPNLLPLRAQHYVLGIEQAFSELLSLDLQFFYNKRYRLVSPSSKVEYVDGTAQYEWYNSDGSGRAFGMEILLRYLPQPNGIFYGWLSYTRSRSTLRDRTPSRDDSRGGGGPQNSAQPALETYLSDFDQPHILTLVAQFELPWSMELGFRFRYVSGNPFTDLTEGLPIYDADGDSYSVDASGVERNSGRIPAFHQLDARLDKNFTFDTWKGAIFIEVLNAYNATNVENYQYSYDYAQKIPITLFPIAPVLGVKGSF